MRVQGLRLCVGRPGVNLPDDLVAGVAGDAIGRTDCLRIPCPVACDDQGIVNTEPVYHLRVLGQFGIADWRDRDRPVLDERLTGFRRRSRESNTSHVLVSGPRVYCSLRSGWRNTWRVKGGRRPVVWPV